MERKRNIFRKSYLNILNIMYFLRLTFQNAIFSQQVILKILVYPISTIFVFAETRAEHRYFVLNLSYV